MCVCVCVKLLIAAQLYVWTLEEIIHVVIFAYLWSTNNKPWWRFNFSSCERGREGEIGVEGEVWHKRADGVFVSDLREKNLRNSAWIGRISGRGGGGRRGGNCSHLLSCSFRQILLCTSEISFSFPRSVLRNKSSRFNISSVPLPSMHLVYVLMCCSYKTLQRCDWSFKGAVCRFNKS